MFKPIFEPYLYICYSRESVKELIDETYKIILDKDDIGLSSIDDFDNLSENSFKIIFTDNLVGISHYIFSNLKYEDFITELRNKRVFIVYIGKKNSFLDTLSYSSAWNNILYIPPSDNDFKEKIKWTILLICAYELFRYGGHYGVDDFIAIYFLSEKGISTLNNFVVSNEEDDFAIILKDLHNYFANKIPKNIAILIREDEDFSSKVALVNENSDVFDDGDAPINYILVKDAFKMSKSYRFIFTTITSYKNF